MNQEAQLRDLIAEDPVRMHTLRIVRDLNLPDCWVAAGFVRSLVWDHLHQRQPSPLPEDIDVLWFDRTRPGHQTVLCENWRKSPVSTMRQSVKI